MNVTLYKTSSPTNKLEKKLESALSLEGTLKADTGVLSPVITDISNENVAGYNYAYIPAFNRYYFISEMNVEYSGLWTISLQVDVLHTYREAIKNQECIVGRQQTTNNLYLNDDKFPIESGRRNPVAIEFPNNILRHDGDMVLTMLG